MREIRIPGIRRVLRLSWSSDTLAREVDDEIRFHIEARVEELVRLGASDKGARERAEAEFGDVSASRAELLHIDRRRVGADHREEIMKSFVEDLRYAARSLRRRPALLAVTVITLAIGIAANAIMFGVVDQLLLRAPAHVVAPDAVKRIYFEDRGTAGVNVGPVATYPTITALREGVAAFSDIAVMGYPNSFSLGSGEDAQAVKAQLVSGNFFRLLGVRPVLGRLFTDDDDVPPQGPLVAMVSNGFWQRQFGGDSAVIGARLPVQGRTFTVIGVLPHGFAGIDRDVVDIWLPVSSMANELLGPGWHNTDNNWWARSIGRLRPGMTAEVAEGQATAVYRAMILESKSKWRDTTSAVGLSSIIGTRTPEGVSRESRVSLWLMGVSAIVLLIACANVANLLVARTMERRREIAVRLALGVGRGRLTRMLLTEAALLSLAGAALAFGIALVAGRLVQEVLLPNVAWSESVVDARVFGFTLGVAMLCTLLAGLAPTVQARGTNVSQGLKTGSRQVAGGRGRLRFGLMLTQTALSVILLIGAGLFVRSLRNVVTRDVGIDHDRVVRVTMPLSLFGFDSVRTEEIFARGAERVSRLPGVTNVAVTRLTYPMGGANASGFSVPGVKNHDIPGGGPYESAVTASYFSTIGATIIRGRDFTLEEERTNARVLVVTEALADAFWPNESPIGKCAMYGADKACSEVIGVVHNVLLFSLINDDRAIVYSTPMHPGNRNALPSAMLIRVADDAEGMVGPIQRELQALAPTMPHVQVRTFADLIAPQLQPWRLGATMFTLFGLIAVVIAAVGLYSVMAYWVSQRTHEIGVRMALGAQRADVVRLVTWQGARAVLAGLAVGTLVAIGASRFVADLMYETSPRDPGIYAAAALVLALAALIASIVPTRRSTSVDPAQAIRTE